MTRLCIRVIFRFLPLSILITKYLGPEMSFFFYKLHFSNDSKFVRVDAPCSPGCKVTEVSSKVKLLLWEVSFFACSTKY